MAPNLAKSTLELIHDMISSGELTTSQMAQAAGCSKRAILRIRSNLRLFGTIKAPPIKAGRPRIGVGQNTRIENAIIDKNTYIGDDVQINCGEMLENGDYGTYTVQDGIVIVKKRAVIPSGTII